MTIRQRERLGLYQKVIETCENNQDVIPPSGDLACYLHGFRAAIAGIPVIDYLANTIKEGKSIVSGTLYSFLCPFAKAVGMGLLHFADDQENNTLQQKITYALSHTTATSQDIRSASFVSMADTLLVYLPSLEKFGLNDSIYLTLNIGIENYLGIAPLRSNIPADPETYQECFRNILYTANMLFKDHIDLLVQDISEEHYHLHHAYRRIRTYGEINYLL